MTTGSPEQVAENHDLSGTKPWKDEEKLRSVTEEVIDKIASSEYEGEPTAEQRQTVQDNLRPKDVAAVFRSAGYDIDSSTIARYLKLYRLLTKDSHKFTGNEVPLRRYRSSPPQIEFPLTESITDQYELSGGQYVRFYIDVDPNSVTGLTLVAETGDFTGEFSNETKLYQPNTYYPVARVPIRIARVAGFYEYIPEVDTDDDGVDVSEVLASDDPDLSLVDAWAELDSIDNSRFRVTPRLPAPMERINSWRPARTESLNSEVDSLTRSKHTLQPVVRDGSLTDSDEDITPDAVEAFKFYPGVDTATAYHLEAGTIFNTHFIRTQTDGDSSIGLVVDFEIKDAASFEGVPDDIADRAAGDIPTSAWETLREAGYQRVQRDHADAEKHKTLCLYPSRASLHALGIGLDDVHPEVEVIPGDNHLTIVPTE